MIVTITGASGFVGTNLTAYLEGENFVAESIVWNKMAIDYKMRYFNEAIYIGEYLEDGLTSNSIRNRRKNSKYSTRLYSELVNNPKVTFRLKLKSIINFWRFSFFNGNSWFKNLKMINNYMLSIVLFPIGYFFYLKDNKSTFVNIRINKDEK